MIRPPMQAQIHQAYNVIKHTMSHADRFVKVKDKVGSEKVQKIRMVSMGSNRSPDSLEPRLLSRR